MTTALRLRRFFSTPKGLLIIVLVLLTAVAAAWEGVAVVAPFLIAGVGIAGVIDVVILRIKRNYWEFPDGAVLTGLFVVMILSPHAGWHVAAWASVIAIISKHAFRSRGANIFNPAALALVIVFYMFGAGQSWWGALPQLPPVALLMVIATGWLIADRVNKIPCVLVFLGVYYLLFTITAFAGSPQRVAEVFRTPDLHMALFFAFFILTDPPTSPVRYPHQVVFAGIVAGASYAFFALVGSVYFLLAGVMVGNIWEAWRRRRVSIAR